MVYSAFNHGNISPKKIGHQCFDLPIRGYCFSGHKNISPNGWDGPTQQMKFTLFALAAISSVFASEAAGKAEAHCPIRGCGTCAGQCPDSTLTTAASLLVDDLCNIIDDKSLNQLQNLVTCKSKLQFILEGQSGCTDSGSLNYLAGVIPLMPNLSCQQKPDIISSTMDGKNRVIVIAENMLKLGNNNIKTVSEHIFEVVNSSCELRLISTKITDENCLPQ